MREVIYFIAYTTGSVMGVSVLFGLISYFSYYFLDISEYRKVFLSLFRLFRIVFLFCIVAVVFLLAFVHGWNLFCKLN